MGDSMNISVENNIQSVLKLKEIYFKKIEFEQYSGTKYDGEVKVSFALKEKCKKDTLEIEIHFTIVGEIAFKLEGELCGIFGIDKIADISIEKLKTNAIAIMFPYLRSQVTLLTTQPTMIPIVLPPININKLITKID